MAEPTEPSSTKFTIAVAGRVNAGKTSLVNVLVDRREREGVSSVAGETKEPTSYQFPGGLAIEMVDTPGLQDAEDPQRPLKALQAAHKADLILHLMSVDEGWGRDVAADHQQLSATGKPIIFVITKCDLKRRDEQLLVKWQCREQLSGLEPMLVNTRTRRGLKKLADTIRAHARTAEEKKAVDDALGGWWILFLPLAIPVLALDYAWGFFTRSSKES